MPLDLTEEEQPAPACDICGDFGWVRVQVPVGHPYFGKVFLCQCRDRADDPSRLERLQRYSNMGLLTRLVFESTTPDGRSADADDRALFRLAFHAAAAYAEEPQGWLVFTGPSGAGKTHLAAAVANRVMELGRPVFFVFVPDLLDHLRSTYTPTSDITYDQLFEQVRTAPLLVLDDLGGHSSTPWAQEKLYQVLNYRHLSQLPTVITIGVQPESLDERWQTRVRDPQLSALYALGAGGGRGAGEEWGIVEPELRRRMTFESFDVAGAYGKPRAKGNSAGCPQIGPELHSDPQGWLVLTGPSGAGKTHLAAAVANRVMELGRPVFFVFVPDLLDHLRSTYTPTSEITYDLLFEQVRTAPLLVLDDLGGHSSTPWAQEKLYQVLNYRHLSQLPTVITIGVPPESLDERWQTRIWDPQISTSYALDAGRGVGDERGMVEPDLTRLAFERTVSDGRGADTDDRCCFVSPTTRRRPMPRSRRAGLCSQAPAAGKTHLAAAVANRVMDSAGRCSSSSCRTCSTTCAPRTHRRARSRTTNSSSRCVPLRCWSWTTLAVTAARPGRRRSCTRC